MEAALLAVSAGALWVEVDVRRAADGLLVLHHDPVLADGRPIESLRRSQLSAAGVQPLERLLEELPGDIGVDLEVKATRADIRRDARTSTAGRVAALSDRLGSRPVCLTSFYPPALVAARAISPDLPLGLLATGSVRLGVALRAATRYRVQVACLHVSTLMRRARARGGRSAASRLALALDATRSRGLDVMVWGVEPTQAPALAAAGAQAVCVDDVRGTVRALWAARDSTQSDR